MVEFYRKNLKIILPRSFLCLSIALLSRNHTEMLQVMVKGMEYLKINYILNLDEMNLPLGCILSLSACI